MPTNGVGSVLKITNRRFFDRENYELRNYEFWRRLHKSLMIRLVRHARSRLGAAFARAGGAAGQRRKAVEEGRRAGRAGRSGAKAPTTIALTLYGRSADSRPVEGRFARR
jgi:hypothetical protein